MDFLQPVKVKRFVRAEKIKDTQPNLVTNHRILKFIENKKPDEIYHVIGISEIKEGRTEFLGSRHLFIPGQIHKVYIVAKSLGKRFKVLEQDLNILDEKVMLIGIDLSKTKDWTVKGSNQEPYLFNIK